MDLILVNDFFCTNFRGLIEPRKTTKISIQQIKMIRFYLDLNFKILFQQRTDLRLREMLEVKYKPT